MSANDSKSSSETNWERIDQLTESEIDTSDIPPLDDAFFTNAELRLPKGKGSGRDERRRRCLSVVQVTGRGIPELD